jgi:hypothetical protein
MYTIEYPLLIIQFLFSSTFFSLWRSL